MSRVITIEIQHAKQRGTGVREIAKRRELLTGTGWKGSQSIHTAWGAFRAEKKANTLRDSDGAYRYYNRLDGGHKGRQPEGKRG